MRLWLAQTAYRFCLLSTSFHEFPLVLAGFALMRVPASWLARCRSRGLATISSSPRVPQTIIEKVVQKYAVDHPAGKAVKAGDYVMIRPEHVMTHDNTGPVITK